MTLLQTLSDTAMSDIDNAVRIAYPEIGRNKILPVGARERVDDKFREIVRTSSQLELTTGGIRVTVCDSGYPHFADKIPRFVANAYPPAGTHMTEPVSAPVASE